MAYAILALVTMIEELIYGRPHAPQDDDNADGNPDPHAYAAHGCG